METIKGQNMEINPEPFSSRKVILAVKKQKLDLNQRNLHLHLLHPAKINILEFTVLRLNPEERKKQEEDDDDDENEESEPGVTDKTLKKLARVIRLSNKIHTLKIDCSECSEITDKGLEYLSESIRGLTSLKCLNLNFKNRYRTCENLTDGGLYHLHQALKTLSSLRDLTLCFQGDEETRIGNSGVSILGKALQILPSLRKIHLEFISLRGITNEGLRSLSYHLSRLSLLKILYLQFEGPGHDDWQMEIDSVGLQILSRNLKKLVSLQNLGLNFYYCQRIGDTGIQDLAQTLRALSSLQRVDLNFNNCPEITQGGVDIIYQSLEKLASLQNIRLDFGRCFELTQVGTENFGRMLKPLSSSLKHLHHDFSGSLKETDIGMENLGEALKSFSFLESLSLTCQFYATVPNAGMKEFSQGLAHLTLLKHVTLRFPSCGSLSDEHVNSLCQSLTKLTLLQSINLDFNLCREITDKAMRCLSEALKSSPSSLRNLRLDFSCCDKITEIGMSDFSQALSQLTCLQVLHLDFEQCERIGQGFRALGQALKNLTGLQSLRLRCDDFGDEEFSSLTEGIKALVLLQNIDILTHWEDVSGECIEEFVKTVKTLKYLQNIYLTLEVSSCEDPQEYVIKSFYPALKTFPYLKNLDIDFRGD